MHIERGLNTDPCRYTATNVVESLSLAHLTKENGIIIENILLQNDNVCIWDT